MGEEFALVEETVKRLLLSQQGICNYCHNRAGQYYPSGAGRQDVSHRYNSESRAAFAICVCGLSAVVGWFQTLCACLILKIAFVWRGSFCIFRFRVLHTY